MQFYETEAFLHRTVADFLTAGLTAGETALVIATAANRDAFGRQLGSAGIGVDRACSDGQLVLLDARETLESIMKGQTIDRQRFATRVGSLIRECMSHASNARPIRAYGEMVDLLWRDGNRDAALQLELLWNELAISQSLSLLCGYHLHRFGQSADGAAFDQICRAHSHVLPSEPAAIGDVRSRYRELARLQQRALALESEVRRRQALEATLREALSEQRRTEESLREQQRQLEIADRAKDQFLAMLAHELRAPLAPITATLQILELQAGAHADVARPVEILTRQSRHLVRLVDDLLEVSRITSGRIRLERRPLDAAVAVHQAVEVIRPLIDSRRHDLRIVLSHEPLWVHADPTRLAQILGNLLHNAAKYTDEGGRIKLTVEREGTEVVFRVLDNGIGISDDLATTVFDLFAQADQSLDRAQGGLGVGLTVVRGLVELHGGTVALHSEGPGQGSEFIVRLPLLQHDERDSPGEHVLKGLDRLPLRRILVVDDNHDAARSLADLLALSGHEVHIANDGPEALDLVREMRPNVVLLDIGLPHMDGYEVARRIREEHGRNGLTLVALTGYGQTNDRCRASDAGFDHHFVKPLDIGLLSAALSRDS